MIGDIEIGSGDTYPPWYVVCDGRLLAVGDYKNLFVVIGYTYGGSDDEFAVPNIDPGVGMGMVFLIKTADE